MHRIILVGIGLSAVCFLGAWYSLPLHRDAGGQRDRLRSQVHNLGVVPPGTTLHTQVQIQNPTSVPLKIDDIRSSCQCMIVGEYESVVSPGSFVEISVNWRVIGSPGSTVSQSVLARCDDGRSEQINVLRATIGASRRLNCVPSVIRIESPDTMQEHESLPLVLAGPERWVNSVPSVVSLSQHPVIELPELETSENPFRRRQIELSFSEAEADNVDAVRFVVDGNEVLRIPVMYENGL